MTFKRLNEPLSYMQWQVVSGAFPVENALNTLRNPMGLLLELKEDDPMQGDDRVLIRAASPGISSLNGLCLALAWASNRAAPIILGVYAEEDVDLQDLPDADEILRAGITRMAYKAALLGILLEALILTLPGLLWLLLRAQQDFSPAWYWMLIVLGLALGPSLSGTLFYYVQKWRWYMNIQPS